MAIDVDKNPSESKLRELGVSEWPVWEKEVSEFPWHYAETETCYILEGSVEVTEQEGQPVQIDKGDLVSFQRGTSCTWKITSPIRKHYRFG